MGGTGTLDSNSGGGDGGKMLRRGATDPGCLEGILFEVAGLRSYRMFLPGHERTCSTVHTGKANQEDSISISCGSWAEVLGSN